MLTGKAYESALALRMTRTGRIREGCPVARSARRARRTFPACSRRAGVSRVMTVDPDEQPTLNLLDDILGNIYTSTQQSTARC